MHLDDEILALYRNSRRAYHRGDIASAELGYRRLRADHGVELFYEIDLPENMLFVHPIGSVLGRAVYGDFLVVYQNAGVGSDIDGNQPTLGNGVVLFPGARVLGNTVIGDNVFVTANTVVQDCVVPSNSVVFSANQGYPEDGIPMAVYAKWRPTTRSVRDHFFPCATSSPNV